MVVISAGTLGFEAFTISRHGDNPQPTCLFLVRELLIVQWDGGVRVIVSNTSV